MSGWMKLHRQMKEWGWYGDTNMVRVWLHILLESNYEDRIWKGIAVKRGQCVFGREIWAESLGISEQSIRTCITRLKSTNEITIQSTNKYSIITIVNYEEYQGGEDEVTSKSTSQLTNQQPATNQQSTTPKEDKKLRSKESNSENKEFSSLGESRKVIFDIDVGCFHGIDDKMLLVWKTTYPNTDIETEIKKAAAWVFSNPKRRKKDYPKFLNGWMARHELDALKQIEEAKKPAAPLGEKLKRMGEGWKD